MLQVPNPYQDLDLNDWNTQNAWKNGLSSFRSATGWWSGDMPEPATDKQMAAVAAAQAAYQATLTARGYVRQEVNKSVTIQPNMTGYNYTIPAFPPTGPPTVLSTAAVTTAATAAVANAAGVAVTGKLSTQAPPP